MSDDTERLSVEDVVDHEDNCAACGVHDRVEDSRYCAGCRDALVRADGGTVEDGTEQSDELIEGCERCGGRLDVNEPGHYKSPDERFVHKVCYEQGEPGDPVVDLTDEYPFQEQWPQQFNCGHYAHGPPRKLPAECPECGVPAP